MITIKGLFFAFCKQQRGVVYLFHTNNVNFPMKYLLFMHILCNFAHETIGMKGSL